ncbi:MAG: hypothetical protein ACRD3S_09455 [Terracidiphilus sp.]
MNETASVAKKSVLTRRTLVRNFAWASAVFAALPHALRITLPGSGDVAARMRPPVISFYMDRLFVDHTGAAMPYHSPLGMRSGAPLAHLSEEALRRAQLYV